MGNLSYIESLKTHHSSSSLYDWIKKDPGNRIKLVYNINRSRKISSNYLDRADRFVDWFKTYPGDGVLYFHDALLSKLSEVFPKDGVFKCPKEYDLLFNYFYSYKPSFSLRSRSVLAYFLFNCPYLAVPLYKYRKKFDPEAFTDLINKMSVYKSFQEYTEGDYGKKITQFMWNVILLHDASKDSHLSLSICDNSVLMHLYYAYTYTAVQRFFFLSTTKAAIKQHVADAYDVCKQTYLLLNNWQENISVLYANAGRRIPQMSSIKAMIQFHNLKAEEILEAQRALETHRHTWEDLSKVIHEVSPEWYLPEYGFDIRLRGQQHHNCVGSYVERHFQSVHENFKMLLLFTDYCEAEVHFNFNEVVIEGKAYFGCTKIVLQQAKTAYNKDIKSSEKAELEKVLQAFFNLPIEYFQPVVKPSTE